MDHQVLDAARDRLLEAVSRRNRVLSKWQWDLRMPTPEHPFTGATLEQWPVRVSLSWSNCGEYRIDLYHYYDSEWRGEYPSDAEYRRGAKWVYPIPDVSEAVKVAEALFSRKVGA